MGWMSLAYLISGCMIPWRLTPAQALAATTQTSVTRVAASLAILAQFTLSLDHNNHFLSSEDKQEIPTVSKQSTGKLN